MTQADARAIAQALEERMRKLLRLQPDALSTMTWSVVG